MRGRVTTSVVIGIVVLALATAPALGVAADPADARAPAPHAQDDFDAVLQDQPEAQTTVIRIDLHADGSATWSIQYRTRLETDDDVEEYRRFQESFRENTSDYLGPFRDRMTGVVAGADDRLDRGMNATEFQAETSIQEVPQRWGVVTYQFTWEGFARTEGERVVAGDVFDDGFYIQDGTVLEVTAPESHVVAEAQPSPDERGEATVEWAGREDFPPGQPRIVTEPADATGGTSDESGGGAGEENAGSALPWVAALALAGTVAGAAVLLYRRDRGEDDGDDGGPAAPVADDPDDDPGVVTDEERVRRLLREHGGRIKQQRIVEELDWSESKTSRVVGRLDEEGAIRKVRIGRENVVELPDDD